MRHPTIAGYYWVRRNDRADRMEWHLAWYPGRGDTWHIEHHARRTIVLQSAYISTWCKCLLPDELAEFDGDIADEWMFPKATDPSELSNGGR